MNGETEALGECPQCGGEVPVALGDHVLRCGHCRTNLFIAGRGPLSYLLPPAPEHDGAAELFHLPYWRLRGLRFRVYDRDPHVAAGLLDLTAPATSFLPESANLGIRTQVGILRLAPPPPARVEPNRTPARVFDAQAAGEQVGPDPGLRFSELIGEGRALVWAPYFLRRDGEWAALVEAFPGGKAHRVTEAEAEAVATLLAAARPAEPLRFLPLQCPNCATDLEGGSGAEVLLCRRCAVAWWPDGERFHRLPYEVLGENVAGERLFPFWQLTFEAKGLPLGSRADLIPWASAFGPERAPASWAAEAPSLLVPGFKIAPNVFLRLAKTASLFFREGERNDGKLDGRREAEPVRLALSEAAEALKTVLGHMALAKRKRIPLVSEATLKVTGARLVYVPFVKERNEWRHPASGQVMTEEALAFGKRL